MNVTFYGAVREVTGSMHLLTTDEDRILLDCGMFQGHRKESEEKNRILPFDPGIITNLILSHAHIDHSGRIPVLTGRDFFGRVVCTSATADACEYLLLDSAKIQESDADYLNYKRVRSFLYQMKQSLRTKTVSKRMMNQIKRILKKDGNEIHREAIQELIQKYHLEAVHPLYTYAEAEQSLGFFDGVPYEHPITIGKDVNCTFYEAGHILGSAISIIKAKENGRSHTIGYTGDLGRFGKPILRDPTLHFPEEDREVDLMIMESTYGNRNHEPIADLKPSLRKVIADTHIRGGSLIIPSFAFGRTQELIYILHEIYHEDRGLRIPIYLDSPLATKLTEVFGRHPEVYDRQAHSDFLEKGENPFFFKEFQFVTSVDQSMALMRERRPHIVIASSGMCEGGRILHHLRYKIHNEQNTILIVGYMARNTLGRRILELGLDYERSGRKGQPPMVTFHNKAYPLKARVIELGGFSAHGDKDELLCFLQKSNLRIKRVALVHGEEEQSLAFADILKGAGFAVTVPRLGQVIRLH
ncbi:MAG: MBL fold metallo-hydrolase [Deltaproteobacteria bacterium]|nr:MBL fold metallo-hydrolase [Deltaproteobacteria bacterium]